MMERQVVGSLISFCWLIVVAEPSARAQSIATDVVIDRHVPEGEALEKAIDYFTSRNFPSVVVGNGRGGLYLYQSKSGQLQGPWLRSVIVARGGAYERARAIRLARPCRQSGARVS